MKNIYRFLFSMYLLCQINQLRAEETYIKGEIIVRLNQDIPGSDIKGKNLNIASIDALGSKWGILVYKRLMPKADKRFPNMSKMLLLKFPETVDIENVCRDYKSDPLVATASPNYKLQYYIAPNDINWGLQWNMISGRANLPDAWDYVYNLPQEIEDGDIVIGILDSGVDTNHVDIRPNLWVNYGEVGVDENGMDKMNNRLDDDNNGYVDDVRGWNYHEDNKEVFNINADPDPGIVYHGTGCAGITAAKTNNSVGVAGMAGGWGVARQGAKIMPVRMVPSEAEGIEAIGYAAANGARVLSMSWGGGDGTALEPALNDAYNNGCVLVAAAGNGAEGPCFSYEHIFTISAPAVCDNVIAVGATIMADTAWGGSQYGSALDVMAPGGYEAGDVRNIYTTFSEILTSSNNYYAYFSGTSAACPHVAGMAALMLQANPHLTNSQVERILKWTADTLASGSLIWVPDDYIDDDYIDVDYGGISKGALHSLVLKPMYYGGDHWNARYGYGRINAYKAVLTARTAPPIPAAPVVPKYKFTTNKVGTSLWSIKVKWDYSQGVTQGYRLYYGNSSGAYVNNLDAGTKNYTTISNATYDNYYFGVKAYNYKGQESGFSNEGDLPNEWWYVEKQDLHEYASFNYYFTSNADATLLYRVHKPYGTTWVQGPSIRKDIADYVIPSDASLTAEWSQYDKAHSLHFELLVQGEDNVDRWLIYSANAPNHWDEQGWVDMGPRTETYNQWETFTRNVSLDFYMEYNVKAAKVKEMRIGHFSYTGWPEGDYGGSVKDISFSTKNWFQVTVQNSFIDAGNTTSYGSIKVNDVVFNSPYSSPWFYSNPNNTIKADSSYPIDGILHYFCSWSDGGKQVHTVSPIDTATYTAYYKKRPYLQGSYDGTGVRLTWDWKVGYRPPYFTQFKLYEFGNSTPIYTGTNNSFYHPTYIPSDGVKSYYMTAHVYGLYAGYIMSNQCKVSGNVSGDPIVSYSTTPEATAHSNGKKLVIDNTGKLHVVFASNDTVFYTSSVDDGETWTAQAAVGQGKNPAIELTANQSPTVCWSKDNELFNSEYLADVWGAPHLIYTGPAGSVVSYLAYALDQNTNNSYLGWVDEGDAGSSVLISPYTPGSSASLAPSPIDQGGANAFKSPSLAIDRTGKLKIAWSHNGKVYYYDQAGQLELGENGIHPIVETYGEMTSVVWQEEIAPGIYQIVKRNKGPLGWNEKQVISYPDEKNADFPVVAANGQYVYSKNTSGKDYDIIWRGEYDNGWMHYERNISYASGGISKYPSAAFRQLWPKSKLYILWSEDTTSAKTKAIAQPISVKIYTQEIEPVPYYYADMGTEEASVYTVQKEGVLTYGQTPDLTVDYHTSQLKYSFSGLDPARSYMLKAIYYHETNDRIQQKMKIDGQQFDVANLKPREKVEFKRWLMPKLYSDGQIEISIDKQKGEYAVCAVLSIEEYEKDCDKAKDGGAQAALSETKPVPYRYELMSNSPNPAKGQTTFRYQLAQPGKTTVKIYNTLGQAVKTVVDAYQQPGVYSVNWDGKDAQGKKVSNGVYFYRINSGEFDATRKMVILK